MTSPMYSSGVTTSTLMTGSSKCKPARRAAPGPGGFEADDDVGVLALAPGLLDVAVLDVLDRLADGLAVRHLGATDVGVPPELAAEPVDEHFEGQLAHPGADRLA